LSAAAHASVQDAFKICTERYNTEKASGTIPVGMSKTTYMHQCTGSIRRAAKLEQELAAGTGNHTQDDATQPGSNEDTTSTTTTKPAATTAKPARIKTALTPRGY
jgi:predicted lipid-binding transport protein (Tim44 family)